MADANTTQDTREKSRYEVTVEDLGAAKKRLSITVPVDVIDEKIRESMGTLVNQTTLPGFRKGRAPRSLIERRFGSTVRQETKSQIIADGYASAIEEHALKPIGEPEPVGSIDDLEIKEGTPLTFAVEVEVVPGFDLPELEGIAIRKPVMEITDAHIGEELRRQCAKIGEVSPVKSEFGPGDRISGPGTITADGEDEPFFSHDQIEFVVPGGNGDDRGHILGLLVEGVRGLVKDKKIGDSLLITTTGPESHEREEIRGKKLTIEMTIREGLHLESAPVERVLEQYEMESEEILREQIKVALEQRRNEEQQAAMREQVEEHLLAAVDFELPEKLSATQAARLLESQRLEMMYRGGLSVDEVETRLAEMRAETEAQSRRRLKLSFLLHRMAEHFEVGVSDQEINGRIAAIAAQRGVRPDQLRTELVQAGRLGQIATQIREHKAADRVIDIASVEEIPADEWNKIAAAKRKTAREKQTSKKKTTAGATTKKKTSRKKTAS